jgi:hypothetical protein
MRPGATAPRPWAPDDVYEDDGWDEPTVLTRGWAATRLVVLILAVGLFTGITIGIALWLTLTALESSV